MLSRKSEKEESGAAEEFKVDLDKFRMAVNKPDLSPYA